MSLTLTDWLKKMKTKNQSESGKLWSLPSQKEIVCGIYSATRKMVLHSWMIYLYTPRITNSKSELKKILKKEARKSEKKKGEKNRKKALTKQKLLKIKANHSLDWMRWICMSLYFFINLENTWREDEEHRNQKIVVIFSLLLFPRFIFAILWQ